MHALCDYLHWMRLNDRKLSFTMTEEDIRHCEISKQRKIYYKFDAYEELVSLTTYQVMSHFAEFTDILNG